MNLKIYELAREMLVSNAFLFKIPMFILCFLFLIVAVNKNLRKFLRYLLVFSFLFLTASFIFIIRFHLIIHQVVNLDTQPIPIENIYLYVPPWIESEKLFFWLFLFFFFALLKVTNTIDENTKIGISIVSAIFSGLVAIFDPFSNPLPLLDLEIREFFRAISHFDYYQIISFKARATYLYNTPYMWIHPPMLFTSYALFLLSIPSLTMGIFSETKKMLEYESFSYQQIKAGYIFLTAGMLIGYPWAIEAWKGESWWWSPKINVSIMMWLFYSAYIHMRIYSGRKWPGRLSCVIGVVSFVALVFTYITTYLIPGVHSYG